MGSLVRPHVTRPLPEGAVVTVEGDDRVARWTNTRGVQRRAVVVDGDDGTDRIRARSRVWLARFNDGTGRTRQVSTGCTGKDDAKHVLADLERRAARVRSGVVTPGEARAAEHADDPVMPHVEKYLQHLAGKRGRGAKDRVSAEHVNNFRRGLTAAVEGCRFKRLRDLDRDVADRWIAREAAADDAPSPRTLNIRLSALSAFGNWLVDTRTTTINPFGRMRKLDEAGSRKVRRALTADELRRLLAIAQLRPLAEYGRERVRRENPAGRRSWSKVPLTADTIAAAADRGRAALHARPDYADHLERVGRERRMLYEVLVTTGLRRGELASLTIGSVVLNADTPHVVAAAADTKSGERAVQPLHPAVAAELRQWIADEHAGAPPTTKLFTVPDCLVRILDRDCRAAGIPKRDAEGRTVDVHALRKTYGSHMIAANVAPRTVQKLMRHKSLELTMQTYCDDTLLPAADAVLRLPALTGYVAPASSLVAPNVALTGGNLGQKDGLNGTTANRRQKKSRAPIAAKNADESTPGASSSDRTRTGDTRLMKPSGRYGNHIKTASETVTVDGCTDGCTGDSGGVCDHHGRLRRRSVAVPTATIESVIEMVAAVPGLSPRQRVRMVRRITGRMARDAAAQRNRSGRTARDA
jgi:site-specific recombinase XerC